MQTCKTNRDQTRGVDPYDGVPWYEYTGEEGKFSAMFAVLPRGASISIGSDEAISIAERVRQARAKQAGDREGDRDDLCSIMFSAAHGRFPDYVRADEEPTFLTYILLGYASLNGALDEVVRTMQEHGGVHLNVIMTETEVNVHMSYPGMPENFGKTLH